MEDDLDLFIGAFVVSIGEMKNKRANEIEVIKSDRTHPSILSFNMDNL